MAVGTAAELEPVAQVAVRLTALLERARQLKPVDAIEPPLPVTELIPGIDALQTGIDERHEQAQKFAVVETAVRQIFSSLISSTDIEDRAFVQVWNLLDILIVCGNRGAAAPELIGWLIEELLDSQTTTGCRVVFDYLESRRERLAARDFHKKNLIFLRACNELLRRLSRAEDAIFCGRVFFFLFQTFPLGDKSSVNLRGEFHVENTTKFEIPDSDQMELDDKPFEGENAPQAAKAETPQPPTKPGQKGTPLRTAQKPPVDVALSTNELYPIFWRLQQDFSDPTRLFAKDKFATFQKGLHHTLTKFKKTPTVVQTKAGNESSRGVKRKAGEDDPSADTLDDKYNPKYLTSRDLFDLELSDLAFQRHIMVQALILIDFLLSLTEKAKKKLAMLEATNKSMLYGITLSAEDAKWCIDTRRTITDLLMSIPSRDEGRFYHRMVETVLTRDKNWVRWKIESCPSIVRDAVSTAQVLESRNGVKDASRPRRMPAQPQGVIDLSFLSEGQGGLDALRDPARWTVPTVDALVDGVRTDKLDLDFAMDDAEKESLQNAISNKTWRTLRQVRSQNLALLNKVEAGKEIEDVLRAPEKVEEPQHEQEAVPSEEEGTPGIDATASAPANVSNADTNDDATDPTAASVEETPVEDRVQAPGEESLA